MEQLPSKPEIRFPLHTTLFFLGVLTRSQQTRVEAWLDSREEIPRITAEILGVRYFGDPVHTCYLALESQKIRALHEELQQFSDLHTDIFSFLPHLSLCFPKDSMDPEEKKQIEKLFAGEKRITFTHLSLGRVSEEGMSVQKEKVLV